MTERRAPWTGLAVLATLSLPAFATGPVRNQPMQQEPTLEQRLRDLSGTDKARRLYAARSLLRQVRHADRQAGRTMGDPILIDEGRQALTDFDLLVAPRCIRQLGVADLTRPCVEMLRILETTEAIDPLESHLADEPRPLLQRRIRITIDELREAL